MSALSALTRLAQVGYMTQMDYTSNKESKQSKSKQAPTDLPGAFYDKQGGLWLSQLVRDEAHRGPAIPLTWSRWSVTSMRFAQSIYCVADSRSNPMEIPTMSSRRVTDDKGRVWECKPETDEAPGSDVSLVCTTAGLSAPLRLKVSWRWSKMAEKGLARMIAAAAPAA